MCRVVLAACRLAAGRERGVEVVGRSVLPLPARDESRDGVLGYPDRAAPSLNFNLEQDMVVDGRNPLVRGAVVGEPLAGPRGPVLLDIQVGAGHRGAERGQRVPNAAALAAGLDQ